jgi:hypothetical protein
MESFMDKKDVSKGKKSQGMTMLSLVNKSLTDLNKEISEAKENITFTSLGKIINQWLKGEIKFMVNGSPDIDGKPYETLKKCEGDGFSVDDLKYLGDKKIDKILPDIQTTVADLSYLLLKNAIAVHDIGYKAPGFKDITSIIDIKEMQKRFKTEKLTEVGNEVAIAPVIIAVDVVVLVLDYARTKA